MDINLIIPDNDQNWVCKKNMLYYFKLAHIPLAKKINGDLFINLDKRCIKPLIKLINHCNRLNIDYLFCDKNSIYEDFIYEEKIDEIFLNNLMMLEVPKFYQMVKSGNLDFVGVICKFIKLYNCNNRFIKVYDEVNVGHFGAKWFDWYDHQHHYRVKDQEIREYFDSLFREVKISLLFS